MSSVRLCTVMAFCLWWPAFGANGDVVTNGLVSWWTFNIPTDPGHDDYGTYNGTPTGCTSTNRTPGTASPMALSLNGVSDKIATATLPVFTSNIAVEAWVYPQALTDYAIFAGNWSVPWVALGFDLAGKVRFRVRAAGGEWEARSAQAIPTNAWSHVVGTYDGAGARIYVNGQEAGSFAWAGGNILNQPNTMFLGSMTASSYFFNGIMDEVRVYNRTLTPPEIRQNFNAIAFRRPPTIVLDDLVSWWSFDNPRDPGYDNYGTNHGVLTGCVSTNRTAGTASAEALSFNGVSDKVTTPALPVFPSNITAEAWVYPRSFTTIQSFVGRWGNPNWVFLGSYDSAGTVRFRVRTTPAAEAEAYGPHTIATGVWSHVVGTFDGVNIRVYVNGVAGTPVARAGNIEAQNVAALFGTMIGNNYYFDGILDEVRIYGKTLTPAEIRQNYRYIDFLPAGTAVLIR